MKVIFLLAVVLIAVMAAPAENLLEAEWKKYKETYQKSYPKEEDRKRFKIFKEAKIDVDQHNKLFKQGRTTYQKGLNQFSDWFPEEKEKLMGNSARLLSKHFIKYI